MAVRHASRGCPEILLWRYTLATGLFRDINKCIRDDNEDGLRRLAWLSVVLWAALLLHISSSTKEVI